MATSSTQKTVTSPSPARVTRPRRALSRVASVSGRLSRKSATRSSIPFSRMAFPASGRSSRSLITWETWSPTWLSWLTARGTASTPKAPAATRNPPTTRVTATARRTRRRRMAAPTTGLRARARKMPRADRMSTAGMSFSIQ